MSASINIYVFTYFLVSTPLVSATCKDKFKVFEGHTACLTKSPKVTESGPDTQQERDEIVNKHNEYRAKVTDATDMMKMTWDDELGMLARKWAENCDYNHEANIKRFIPGKFHVGQNLAKGNVKLTWDKVVSLFYAEVKDFTYNSDSNDFNKVGHYTQLVWAKTYLIGCAYASCGSFHLYVCDYGPAGNANTKTPYTKGTHGAYCKEKDGNNLCDCKGKVCGGDQTTYVTNTCQCKCSPSYLIGDTCQLNCSSYSENPAICGAEGFYKPDKCNMISTTFNCPEMCQVCPFAGIDYVEGSDEVKRSSGNILTPLFVCVVLMLLVAVDIIAQ